MPHRLRKFPRVWALKTPLRRSYRRFFDFWTPNLPTTGNVNKPSRTGKNTAFHCFLFTFCEGKIGGSKGGYHEFGGYEISKIFKLRTDLFHHTHEVWGPRSYKNIPLRRRGPRVLESYCNFQLFQPHFSTLGHFHTTIRLPGRRRKAPRRFTIGRIVRSALVTR